MNTDKFFSLFGKMVLVLIVLGIIAFGGYYFGTKNKSSQLSLTSTSTLTAQPNTSLTETPGTTTASLTPTPTVDEASVKNQIINALSQKNNWDPSNVELNIAAIEGYYAKGDVRFKGEMGGGLWFAANVNGTWKIVYDGNGMITCDQLANYQNFPKDLIPQCWDSNTQKMVQR